MRWLLSIEESNGKRIEVKEIPEFIRYYNAIAVGGAADLYTPNKKAAVIRPSIYDAGLYPRLEEVEKIILVYRKREG